jgi:uncharacterized protein YcnI
VLAALPASAHVRVQADDATAGSYGAFTFRVPTESDTAATTKVEVQLPQDHPLASVSAKPLAGWEVRVVEAPLPTPVTVEGTTLTRAPRTVVWTAVDRTARIAPGQYQEFSLLAGPLPGPGTLTLPAIQTYSDGKVVHWDQPTPASGEEPESPAPTVEVTAAAADPGAVSTPAPAPAQAASVVPDPLARALGGAALALAVIGVVLATLTWRRTRVSR